MWKCDFSEMAKDILSSIEETPYNKEIIDSWREVAVSYNAEGIYNTAEIFE